MKMTVEIPEKLFREAKIVSAESGTTMRELVIRALTRELRNPSVEEAQVPYFSARTPTKEYRALRNKGVFRGGQDSSIQVESERDER